GGDAGEPAIQARGEGGHGMFLPARARHRRTVGRKPCRGARRPWSVQACTSSTDCKACATCIGGVVMVVADTPAPRPVTLPAAAVRELTLAASALGIPGRAPRRAT